MGLPCFIYGMLLKLECTTQLCRPFGYPCFHATRPNVSVVLDLAMNLTLGRCAGQPCALKWSGMHQPARCPKLLACLPAHHVTRFFEAQRGLLKEPGILPAMFPPTRGQPRVLNFWEVPAGQWCLDFAAMAGNMH